MERYMILDLLVVVETLEIVTLIYSGTTVVAVAVDQITVGTVCVTSCVARLLAVDTT